VADVVARRVARGAKGVEDDLARVEAFLRRGAPRDRLEDEVRRVPRLPAHAPRDRREAPRAARVREEVGLLMAPADDGRDPVVARRAAVLRLDLHRVVAALAPRDRL
jgi:hypothetical protein